LTPVTLPRQVQGALARPIAHRTNSPGTAGGAAASPGRRSSVAAMVADYRDGSSAAPATHARMNNMRMEATRKSAPTISTSSRNVLGGGAGRSPDMSGGGPSPFRDDLLNGGKAGARASSRGPSGPGRTRSSDLDAARDPSFNGSPSGKGLSAVRQLRVR